MSKRILLITSFIISCFIFTGCKKDSGSSKSSNYLIGSTVTLRSNFAGHEIEVLSVDSNIPIRFSNEVKVVIKSVDTDHLEYTAEGILNGKKQLIKGSFNDNLHFDFDTMLKAVDDAVLTKIYTKIVFRNPDTQLSHEQIITLYNTFLSKLPENFLKTYSGNDEKSKFYIEIIHSLLDLINNPYLSQDIHKTTIFHLIAESANEEFTAESISYHYFHEVQDEEGRIPLIRAILKENYEACKVFYKDRYSIKDIKDKNGKSYTDYVRESSNEKIKNLFLVFDEEKLVQEYLPQVMELQFSENFKTIDFKTYEVPYTLFYRAASKNIYIDTDSKENFVTELALQEQMLLLEDGSESDSDSESEDDENNIKPELKFPSDIAFVFSRTEEGSIDKSTELKLRASPSNDAKETGCLDYGTKVNVLERSENPDVIADISDYWYKVKSDNNEGWCFGGFLFAAVQNKNYKKSEENRYDNWITQNKFEKNSFAFVGVDSVILENDGKKTAVQPGNRVEILAGIPYENYINKDTKLEFYAYDPNLVWFAHNDTYIQYPYYVVRDDCNNIGVMSGIDLAHVCNADSYIDEDIAFYLSFAENYADIFEYDEKTKKGRRYNFAKSEGIAVQPALFNIGWSLIKGEHDYPVLSFRDIFNFEDYIGTDEDTKTKLKVVVFAGNGYGEMREEIITYYTVFTVTDHFAVISHKSYCYGFSVDNTNFSSSRLELYFNKNKKLTAEEIESSSWQDYNEAQDCNETKQHSHYNYYKWDNTTLTFEKTGEKDTDYIDER
ncbi:MAG: SH3 domain-containing protein [Treponema sp.]|nr:SH3 domain-containing protein [Candidatus Treponema merdequi]